MLKDTKNASTQAVPFGCKSAGEHLFLVQSDIPLQVALGHASVLMGCASTLLSETVDADPKVLRTLHSAALHFVEASQALIQASLEGNDRRG